MAYRAFHRPLLAGVALAGAGAIAFASVPAVPVDRPVAAAPAVGEQTPMVALTGFAEVLAGVVTAVQQSGDALVNASPALYWQVHEQWPEPELLPWNYALFTDIFLAPLAPLVVGPVNDAVAQAVAEALPGQADVILRIPDLIEYAVVRAVGPLLSAIGAAGAAHEQIYHATTTWEVAPFVEAIVAAPGYVIDGFLNGGYGDLRPLLTGEVGGEPVAAPGLLTPWGVEPVRRYADDSASLLDSAAPADRIQQKVDASDSPPVTAGTRPESPAAAEEHAVEIDKPLAPRVIRDDARAVRADAGQRGSRSTEPPSPNRGGRGADAADSAPSRPARSSSPEGPAVALGPTRRDYGADAGAGSTSKPLSIRAASR